MTESAQTALNVLEQGGMHGPQITDKKKKEAHPH